MLKTPEIQTPKDSLYEPQPSETKLAAEDIHKNWSPEEKTTAIPQDIDGNPTNYAQLIKNEKTPSLVSASVNSIIDKVKKTSGATNGTNFRNRLTKTTFQGIAQFKKTSFVEKIRHFWLGNEKNSGIVNSESMSGYQGSFKEQGELVIAPQKNKLTLSTEALYVALENFHTQNKLQEKISDHLLILDKNGSEGKLIQIVNNKNELIDPNTLIKKVAQAKNGPENRVNLIETTAIKNFLAEIAKNTARKQSPPRGDKNLVDIFLETHPQHKLSQQTIKNLREIEGKMDRIAVVFDPQPESASHVPLHNHTTWKNSYIATLSTRAHPSNPKKITLTINSHHTQLDGLQTEDALLNIQEKATKIHFNKQPLLSTNFTNPEESSYSFSSQTKKELCLLYGYETINPKTNQTELTPKGIKLYNKDHPRPIDSITTNWIKMPLPSPENIKSFHQNTEQALKEILEEKPQLKTIVRESIKNIVKNKRASNQIPPELQSKDDDQLLEIYYQGILKNITHPTDSLLLTLIYENVSRHASFPILNIAALPNNELSLFMLACNRDGNGGTSLFPQNKKVDYHNAALLALQNWTSLNQIRSLNQAGISDITTTITAAGSEGIVSKALQFSTNIIGGDPSLTGQVLRESSNFISILPANPKELKLQQELNQVTKEPQLDLGKNCFLGTSAYAQNLSGKIHIDPITGNKYVMLRLSINHNFTDTPPNKSGLTLALRHLVSTLDSNNEETKLTLADLIPNTNQDEESNNQTVQLSSPQGQTVLMSAESFSQDLSQKEKDQMFTAFQKSNPQVNWSSANITTFFKKTFARNPYQELEEMTDKIEVTNFLSNIKKQPDGNQLLVKILSDHPTMLHHIFSNKKIIKKLRRAYSTNAYTDIKNALEAIK